MPNCAGKPASEVLSEMRRRRVDDVNFRAGRSFGLTYHASPEIDAFIGQITKEFAIENAFSPHAMPSIRKFQADIVDFTISMLHGGSDVSGGVTSGGTESILMAVKTAKSLSVEWKHPNGGSVVGPVTAHPAFHKACEIYSLDWIGVPVGPDYRASADAFDAAFRPDTILSVGSAPSYPWGMIDDIAGFASASRRRGVPFHVDACIGGFLLPFFEQLSSPIQPWDFRVPGVTSISADIHKFGYGARGASVILHRPGHNIVHQRFAFSDWPGGRYSTQALLGSRPAAPIAVAWGIIQHLGLGGYRALAAQAMLATNKLKVAMNDIDGLHLIGAPDASVIAIGSDRNDMPTVARRLREANFYVQQQQHPSAIHLMISAGNLYVMDEFIRALKRASRLEDSTIASLQPYGDGEHDDEALAAALTREKTKAWIA